MSENAHFHPWELGFKQSGLRHITRVLHGSAINAFTTPHAFPPCCCPLAVSRPGQAGDPEASSFRTSTLCEGDPTRVRRRNFALRSAFPTSVTGRHTRDYYEASAPPGAHGGQRACPFPYWLHETRATPDGSHVHHTTDRRGRRPALPQRHRHDYAVGFHRGLPPKGNQLRRGVPDQQPPVGAHRNPAHIRQI